MTQASWRDQVTPIRQSIADGRQVSQDEILQWTAAWLGQVKPRGNETEELRLVDHQGQAYAQQVMAPRWLCHLLGLRHACSHIMLTWDSPTLGPVLVCQVRSWDKPDFPGHVDISVGGHVVGQADRETTAWVEMQQELGLERKDLAQETLKRVGGYAFDLAEPERYFYDAEWRDVYVGKLVNLDAIHFVDGEVTAVTLCPLSQARQLLAQECLPVAHGLKASLPLCLDYWEECHAG